MDEYHGFMFHPVLTPLVIDELKLKSYSEQTKFILHGCETKFQVQIMDNYSVPETSRLLQDILNLEKDFKYNLDLLKIRETEIERCSVINQTLQETLKLKLSDIAEKNFKITNLQNAIVELEQTRKQDSKTNQQTIETITKNFNEINQKHKFSLEQHQRSIKEKEDGLKRTHSEILNAQQTVHKEKSETLQEQLRKEINNANRHKSNVQTLTGQNSALRNKIREIESKYCSETAFYKEELQQFRNESVGLKGEVATVKSELSKIEMVKEELKINLQDANEKISNLINEIREVVHGHEREKNEWLEEAERIKNSCNVSEHRNYSEMLSQNNVLREIVKEMRKERHNAEINELRVRKLEELIEKLKICEDYY